MTKAKKMTSAFIAAAAALICALFFMLPMTASAEDCTHTDSNSDGFCDNGCGAYNFNCGTDDWATYTPITTAAELQAINDDLDGNYVLMNDIDLDGVTWTPIGANAYFTGKFSGNGHVIENIIVSDVDYAGLFNKNDGLIMNVGIASGSISGTNASGICVDNYGTIFGCYNNADITGSAQYTGGICYENRNTIENCLNSGSVNNTYVFAGITIATGGIAGHNFSSAEISNCVNIGSVSSEDEANAIVGFDDLLGRYITNCYYLDSTAEHALYYSYEDSEGHPDSGKMTLAELCALDIDGNGAVWSAGSASFTAEDVTVDENDERMGTASVKLPYLTAFGENAQQTAELDVYNFSLTDTPDWQTYTPITTAAELQDINDDLDGNFVLMNDIDLGGEEWTPIGTIYDGFTGKFSGNGHVIENIIVSDVDYAGLFNNNDGLIMNVGIESGSISGTYAGGICVDNYGTIFGCYNNADITGSFQYTGGICYTNYGTIDNCLNSGSVNNTEVDSYTTDAAGGIAGYNGSSAAISNCVNIGSVSSEDEANAIVGNDVAFGQNITNCYYLDSTAEHALYYEDEGYEDYSDSGKMTISELCGALPSGLSDTAWSAGAVTVGIANGNFRTDTVTMPYLTVFGEGSAPSLTVDKFNFGYNGSDDWQTYTPITTAAELQAIEDDLDGNFVLMNDIDLDGVTWTPIGTIYDRFTGKFSGNGHVIENITISSGTYVGLFNQNNGLIMNVGIASGSISGTYAGGICVNNYGMIFGCYNNADITGSSQFTGGICYDNRNTIENCLNSGSVNNTYVFAGITIATGGIAGHNFSLAEISNCVNIGSVSSEDEANAIVGFDDLLGRYITNCYYLDSTAEHALYYSYEGSEGHPDSGKMTLAELCALDIDGNGTVWSAGSASFTAEDVTVDENNERMGTVSVKLPYLTVFGENAQQTAEVKVYNFSLTDTPDWQTYTPITTAEQLQAIKDDLDGNYVLMNDIDLDGFTWTPFGVNSDFTGKFSGNSKVVKNLTITTQDNYIGLFGINRGLIMNLGVEGTVTSSGYYVGGIVGLNYGTISGCYFKGDVSAQAQQGGIVGWNAQEGIVDNCFAIGSVTGSGNYAGGIVGFNDGTIRHSYCASTVTLTGEYTDKGGVCGTNIGTITNCFYNKDIYTDEDSTVGVTGLSTLDMTAADVLTTMGFDTDVWGYKAADKDNCTAYYPYLKGFGEDSAASVFYETKISFMYDESKDAPVYGEDLYFIVSALVKFDGMEEFVPVEGGSFRFAYAGAEISDYYTIPDSKEIVVTLAFPDRLCAGDQVIYLEYDGSDSEFISGCVEVLEIGIEKAVIDSVTIEMDAPQPEVDLDMEPVVTPEGMYYELTWYDTGGCVIDAIAEYGETYYAYLNMQADENHVFADTVTVTAPTEHFEVEFLGDGLYVWIYYPDLPEELKPGISVCAGDGEALIVWSPLEGATSYRVYSYDGTSYKLLATTTETSYTATGLDNGVEYGFLVRALIDGEWTNFDTEKDVVYVTPVEGMKPIIAAYPENYQVILEWENIIGAERYRVYSYLNGKYTLEDEITNTWYTVEGLKAGVEYGFLVRAYIDGKWTSFTTDDNVYATPTAAECPVLSLNEYVNNIDVFWSEVTGATKYRVYSYLNGGYTLIAETEECYYEVYGLTAGVEYGFLVRAYAGGKWTPFDTDSDVYYATPKSADCPVPVLTSEVHRADLTWDAVFGAENYRVYSYLNGKFALLGETTETWYSATGLMGGKEYGFLVRAYVAGRWTEFDTDSDVAYIYTDDADCPVITLEQVELDCVFIEWDAVEDASNYRVYSYLDGKYTLLQVVEGTVCVADDLYADTEYGFLVRAYVNGAWTAFTTDDNEYIYVDSMWMSA